MASFDLTVACQDRDFPEWHGGRSHALVWALEVDELELREAVAAARARLDGLVLPRYERQTHVTVAFAGLAAQDGLAGYDEEQLEADLTRLRPHLDGPVELRATGWGTFQMVPYLTIASPWLADAHRVLDDGVGAEHGMSYLPHVTLGHWSGQWRPQDVLERLDGPLPSGTWSVGELSLLRYETNDIAGALERVGRLELSSGVWATDRY